jgi:hypothetical protein
MNSTYQKLLKSASNPIGSTVPDTVTDRSENNQNEALFGELLTLLQQRNGFYAFESALLLRPLSCEGEPKGIRQWNRLDIWRVDYMLEGSDLFFAEDLFGFQFCISTGRVKSFNPETGIFKEIASTLHEWIDWLFADYKMRTGWPLGHSWQLSHGPLQPGFRLVPKVPFVLGGKFSLKNLYECSELEAIRFRGNLAKQIRNCPDGTTVKISITT